MALDHILMRPQALTRRIGPAEDRIAEEIMDLTSRLIADVAKGGRAKDKLMEGMQEAMEAALVDFKTRIGNATTSLKAWLDPIIEAITTLATSFSEMGSTGEAIHALARCILLLADLLGSLGTVEIEAKLNALFRIITEDLGVTRVRMEALFANMVDVVAQKMKAAFIGGEHTEQAHNEYLIGCYLEKLKRFMGGILDQLEIDLDPQHIVTMVSGYIQGLDWDNIRLVAQGILNDTGNTIESLAILFDIFSGKFNVTVTVEVSGSASSGSNSVSGSGSGSVGTGDLDPVSWYGTYLERKPFRNWPKAVDNRDQLDQDPLFQNYTYRRVSLQGMEEFAHVSDVLASTFEALLHLRSLERKDVASNLLHAGTSIGELILTALLAKNTDPGWVTFYQGAHNTITDILGSIFYGLVLSGWESAHTFRGEEQGIFWITLVGKDVTEALLYKNWIARLRQGLLSLLTLLNTDQATLPNSKNHEHVDGFAMLVSEIFSWIGASYSGRKNFGFPAHGGPGKFIGLWVAGACTAWVGGIVGWLGGWGLSQIDKPDGRDDDNYFPGWPAFGFITLESLLAGAFKHQIYSYFEWNGKTDGGKFGQDTARAEQVFKKGYPQDKSLSPYKQPFAKGTVRQCAQNNLGPWSHNFNTNQIYAYDWDHDHGTEVLAMRGGTVQGFSDAIPDHCKDWDNNLQITHDDADEGAIPNPNADWDWTSETVPVSTTGQYIHGKHFGVRHVFAAMGIPLANIIGTRVSQGRFVMFSGSTGMSFYNHLHAHVSSPNSRSIPFVFKDSPHDDGRLKDLTWYDSDNERKADVTGLSPICPPEQQSLVLRTQMLLFSVNAAEVSLKYSGSSAVTGVGHDFGPKNILAGCSVVFVVPNGADTCIEILESKWDQAAFELKLKLKSNWPTAVAPAASRVNLESRARECTSNTIKLDGLADFSRDDYSGAMIYVWWKDSSGRTITEIQRIASYDHSKDKRIATIQGTWGTTPPSGANFEIGQRPYAQANAFKRRFPYLSVDSPPANAEPLYRIAAMASLPTVTYQGTIATGGPKGGMTLTLDGSAPNDPLAIQGQLMCISDVSLSSFGAQILAVLDIASYDHMTKVVTLSAGLPIPVIAVHHYTIGANRYHHATATEKAANVYLCPDDDPNTYSPMNFSDGRTPYLTKTF